MNKKSEILFYYARTSVHAGSGSSLEVIDLPIQREKHTNFPIFQASSVKGSIRRFFEYSDTDGNAESIFGPEGGNDNDFASCISFTDARVLFFPVKSFKDVFVWITSPFVLKRFQADLKAGGLNIEFEIPNQSITEDKAINLGSKNLLIDGKLIIDEYVFSLEESQVSNWEKINEKILSILPWAEDLREKLIIVSDEIFKYFVTTGTEVVARTKINKESGVVDSGSLWYEENLPSETILYSVVFALNSRDKNKREELTADNVLENVKEAIGQFIQIGGNETIGKGVIELSWIKGE